MNRIFKLEIKRAFRNRLFAATLCVAFAICVWHFMKCVDMEDVCLLRHVSIVCI